MIIVYKSIEYTLFQADQVAAQPFTFHPFNRIGYPKPLRKDKGMSRILLSFFQRIIPQNLQLLIQDSQEKLPIPHQEGVIIFSYRCLFSQSLLRNAIIDFSVGIVE
jgi:hypothetical protein